MRRPLIGGNWKMNGSAESGKDFFSEMARRRASSHTVETVVFPPFTLISRLSGAAAAAGVQLGGQDLFWEQGGAFTGEISPGMLTDSGCTWFLAGHSERRHVIGENDQVVRRKLEAGLAAGLKGILCVGELLEQREEGHTDEVVSRQILLGISGLGATPGNLVIAYEPVWAIGTGLNATPEEAQRVHSLIRGWLADSGGREFADETRIIYGGSVSPANAAAILAGEDVDGALVGGASLAAGSLLDIISAAVG